VRKGVLLEPHSRLTIETPLAGQTSEPSHYSPNPLP